LLIKSLFFSVVELMTLLYMHASLFIYALGYLGSTNFKD
jgi:hypothetical protein